VNAALERGRSKRRGLKPGLLALALLLAACPRVVRPLEAPRVELRGVGGALPALELELAVQNPNDRALELRAIDWEIDVDGRTVARGRAEQVAPLPARAAAAVRAPITLGAGAAAAVRAAASAGGETRVAGALHFARAGGGGAVMATFDAPATVN
jgi:LEA14-like dessication related protein